MVELSPQDVARRTFEVARRGYEQQEVRGFLHEVSALLERLSRADAELRDRAERAEAKLGLAEQPDEETLLAVLGEETTRVLTSAREAAGEIRSKAEAAAERIIAEATSEAAELRGNAVREADALIAETKAESESILEAARTELDRRAAEAEEAAAGIRAEGEAEVQRRREEGQAELARLRAEGDAVVEAAKLQGRTMVAEAQAVRERVLRDLAVRRKRARQQVEKLNAGRERLLKAYELVRRTIDEATAELHGSLAEARTAADAAARRIEEEPEPTLEELDAEVADAGLIDLPIADLDHDHDHEDDSPGPFSGEVPAVTVAPAERPVPTVAATPAPAPAPVERADVREPEGAVPAAADDEGTARPPVRLDERRNRKGRRKKGFEGLPPAELTVVDLPNPEEGVRILAEPAGEEAEGAAPAAAEGSEPAAEETAPAADRAEAGSAEAAPSAPEEEAEAEPAAEATPPPSAEDAFAKLRADQAAAAEAEAEPEPAPEAATVEPAEEPEAAQVEEAAAEEAAEPELSAEPAPADEAAPPGPDAAVFAARAAVVGPVEKELGRRLKRALADEQNEVLDLLRRAKPKGVDDLLPSVDEHAGRWADVVSAALADAAAAGAAFSGGTASTITDLADELARSLTAPLRDRIDRSFVASDGNLDDVADRVRALYREWKGQRLTETLQHYAAAAYARGLFDGIEAGTPVRWAVDPSAGACPDCDDNLLGGEIPKGDDFPTGSPCAPAHPGCHCLVLPAAS